MGLLVRCVTKRSWVLVIFGMVFLLAGSLLAGCSSGEATTTTLSATTTALSATTTALSATTTALPATTTALPATTTTVGLDKAKFATVWADIKAIEAATSGEVSYPQFGPLVQKLVTDLSLVPQSNTTSNEAAAGGALAVVAQAYSDSYRLCGNTLQYPNILPVVPREEANLYGLEGTPSSTGSGLVDVSRDAFKHIWTWASQVADTLAPDLAP